MNLEISKDPPDFRCVIKRKQKPALNTLKQFCQLNVFFLIEIEFVIGSVEIRRIKIKEGIGAVVAVNDFLVRQAFKLDPKQPFMGTVQDQRNAVWIVIRAVLNADFEMLPFDQPAVAVLLEIQWVT